MSGIGHITLGVCFLILFFILARKVLSWRIRQSYRSIIKDLKRNGALDPASALELPYAQKGTFRVGVRDYRPQALQFLVSNEIVGVTDKGCYYLKNKDFEVKG